MADPPSHTALDEFLSEAQETLEGLERGLARLEDTRAGQEPDPDTLNSVFRAAHSLKGLSAMFGVERMTGLAHALEDLLDDLRMGRRPLDAATLDLLLAAAGLFGRIIVEEAAQRPPATGEAVQELAAKLRLSGAPDRGGEADPLADVALEDAVRAVLTEYEEHRLRASVQKGLRLYRVRVTFRLDTFDADLEAMKARLKPLGEVISTLPAPLAADPDAIAFDVLCGSAHPIDPVREAVGAAASVEEVLRRSASPAPAPVAAAPVAPAPQPEVPAPPPAAPGPSAPAQARKEDAPPPAEARKEDAPPPTTAPPAARPPEAPLATVRSVSSPPAAPRLVGGLSGEADASLRSVSQAVRVDIHKLDRLMNLVGELLLVKTSLLRIADRLRSGDESTTLGLELHRESRSLDRKLNELQGGILEVRMVPLGQIFDKLARMVRKLARDLGKQVELEVRGSEVELDKLLVEELSDPLMHLLRNALDHGIEPPAQRLELGKPPAGRITLSASQKGNHAVIALTDDGVGMDERCIRETAVRRGLVPAEVAAQLSRREALNLIFVPGFTTAQEVTTLSGRGVGMDVVKNNIAAMSGMIDLHTELGKGTRFEITLPLTLAIVRALVVSAAGRSYAVPLSSVLEVVTLQPAEVRTIETREVMSLRGSTLPLIRLGRFFRTADAAAPDAAPLFVVVVGLAQERLGVAVDALVGQQDIVVKPLGGALAGVRGIAGATDLGNRRTILVLDVGAILEEVIHGEARVEAGGS